MEIAARKKLIVGGCSITHGAELVNGFMHPGNVAQSYSRHLADRLDTDLVNVALSGGSNDDIFHALVQQIDHTATEEIHSVIAAWTWVNRLHWVNKNRHWFFIPGWASSMNNPYNWKSHQHPSSQAFITCDNPRLLPTLEAQHQFLVDHYLDDDKWLLTRLANYKSALQSHCDACGVRLIQVDIFAVWNGSGHPNHQQHRELAQWFHDQYYQTPSGV